MTQTATTPIPSHIFRRAADAIAAEHPEIWQIAYPRIYEEPKRDCGIYYSTKAAAVDIAGVAMKWNSGYNGTNERSELLWASRLVDCRIPMYWVSAQMAQAIGYTNPPMEIDWHNMNLPFEGIVFMVPKGTLVHPIEGDLTYVSFSRLRMGENHTSLLINSKNGLPRVYGYINGCLVITFSTVSGLLTHRNYPYDNLPIIRLPQLEQYIETVKDRPSMVNAFDKGAPEVVSDVDNAMIIKVTHFIFGALLLMMRKPELVTTGRLIRRVQKSDKVNEFWSPNILGEKYRIRRPDAQGTHNSPIGHWVCGYWREHAHGPGLTLRKEIWIEPYPRGFEGKEKTRSASA
jgi:hypothetical protein